MTTDFLVVGSGVAGLRAAIALGAVGEVLVLTKADPGESNTGYAQGGIAAAVGPDDSPALHARDTIEAGDGLCRVEAVDVLVKDGPGYVRELLDWGAAFDREASGAPALGREAAHSVRRVLHARDATGREIGRVLWARASAIPRVRVLDVALVLSLRTQDGECVGATFVDRQGEVHEVAAAQTLLATGGAGQVFRETTNPAVATGDGMAMAFEAGARVADLEFVQFHPTVLSVTGAPRFLLSEALRGEGGRLLNAAGDAFTARYDAAGDLAPRDVVARAIVREQQATGAPVYLSMAQVDADYVRRRFPTITEACRAAGLDLATDLIPVSPAAHYMMGGVETDLEGRTSLLRLFAAGEVACTGVHGANRLASNSLLEGLVFGARAAAAMQERVRPAALDERGLHPLRSDLDHGSAHASADDIRELMWRDAGLLRSRDGLVRAVGQLGAWQAGAAEARRRQPHDRGLRRLASLATVGWLIATAALRREESRGGHFREDFPRRDDLHWTRRVSDVRDSVAPRPTPVPGSVPRAVPGSLA
jgi:L-aspartate oxidase